MVEIAQKTGVEGDAGAEDGGEHHLRLEHGGIGGRQGGVDATGGVGEGFGDLIGHDLAYALEIGAEAEHVVLGVDVAQFGHILPHERWGFGKIDDFHGCIVRSRSVKSLFNNK